MGRNKTPFASILHLACAMRLYIHMRGVSPIQEIGEKRFIEDLSEALAKDKIIGAAASRNLTNKFRGMIFYNNMEECNEGLDVDRLDILAREVIAHYGLTEKLCIQPTNSPWVDFQKYVFEVPDYFRHLQKFKYYKFLSPQDKHAVDGFVERQINQLDLGINDVHTYCLYVWNKEHSEVRSAILQIDRATQVANYTFYLPDTGTWRLRTVQRSDRPGGLFEFANNTLFINLIEENESKKQIHASLFLAVRDVEFYRQKYIKGILASSSQNAIVPTSWVIILEKKSTYLDAYNTATNTSTIAPEITLEILGARTDVKEENIANFSHFRTHRINMILKQIAGAYVFGFLTQPDGDSKFSTRWTKGICFINRNGLTVSKIPDEKRLPAKH